jgi:hypothetical protein
MLSRVVDYIKQCLFYELPVTIAFIDSCQILFILEMSGVDTALGIQSSGLHVAPIFARSMQMGR